MDSMEKWTVWTMLSQKHAAELQKFVRVFGKLGWVFEKLDRVFYNKHSAECFAIESSWKSGL